MKPVTDPGPQQHTRGEATGNAGGRGVCADLHRPRVLLAVLGLLAATGCVSVSTVDPVQDDGSPGFAAACVGVLAAERAASERGGAHFTVEGYRALNEWMFQASRRSSLIADEIGRAAERRRWAEALPAEARQARAKTCIAAAQS